MCALWKDFGKQQPQTVDSFKLRKCKLEINSSVSQFQSDCVEFYVAFFTFLLPVLLFSIYSLYYYLLGLVACTYISKLKGFNSFNNIWNDKWHSAMLSYISQWNHRDIVEMQCNMLDLTPRTRDGHPSGVRLEHCGQWYRRLWFR